MHCTIKNIHNLQGQTVKKEEFLKINKKYEEEIKELLQERLGQIYKNLVNEKIVK